MSFTNDLQLELLTAAVIVNSHTMNCWNPREFGVKKIELEYLQLNSPADYQVLWKKFPQYITKNRYNFKPMDASNNYGELSMTNITEVKNNHILPKFKYDEFVLIIG